MIGSEQLSLWFLFNSAQLRLIFGSSYFRGLGFDWLQSVFILNVKSQTSGLSIPTLPNLTQLKSTQSKSNQPNLTQLNPTQLNLLNPTQLNQTQLNKSELVSTQPNITKPIKIQPNPKVSIQPKANLCWAERVLIRQIWANQYYSLI